VLIVKAPESRDMLAEAERILQKISPVPAGNQYKFSASYASLLDLSPVANYLATGDKCFPVRASRHRKATSLIKKKFHEIYLSCAALHQL